MFFRWEEKILKITQDMGIGAQFGGKYFCHDVRVIRLPRHGASCPVGVGVSCSADRQILGKINEDGIFLEELEANPGQFLPEVTEESLEGEEVAEVVKVRRPPCLSLLLSLALSQCIFRLDLRKMCGLRFTESDSMPSILSYFNEVSGWLCRNVFDCQAPWH